MNKLEGDQFTTDEWVLAQKEDKPVSGPEECPDELLNAMNQFAAIGKRLGIPVVAAVVLKDEVLTESELGDKPENIPVNVLLARGGLVANAEYNQYLFTRGMNSLGNAFLRK